MHKIAIKDHHFFHRMEESEMPIMESIDASPFAEFPSLYEVYADQPNVILEESTVTPQACDSQGKDTTKNGAMHLLTAFLLDRRFIVVQHLDDYSVARYNLPGASRVSKNALRRWWYFRELMNTRRGREKMSAAGFPISKPRQP